MGVQTRVGAVRSASPAMANTSARIVEKRMGDDDDDDDDDEAYETPWDGEGEDGRVRKTFGANLQQAQASTSKAPHPVGTNTTTVPRSQPIPRPTPPSSEAPQRRKSVRVSLQPTFSPTPPAFDNREDYEEGQGFWRPVVPDKPTRRRSRLLNQSLDGPLVATNPRSRARDDIWQDSDDEDEEYARAKMMLSRAGAEEKKVYATAAVLS